MKRLVETYVVEIEGTLQEIEARIQEAKTKAMSATHWDAEKLIATVREQNYNATKDQAQNGIAAYELTIDVWEIIDKEEG